MNTRILDNCFDKKPKHFESCYETPHSAIIVAKGMHRKLKYVLMYFVTTKKKLANSVHIVVFILFMQ